MSKDNDGWEVIGGPAQPASSNDGWEVLGDGWETVSPTKKRDATWRENLRAGWVDALGVLDVGISLHAGALASKFSQEEGDRIFREMDERRERRRKTRLPENVEQDFGGKVISAVGSLPAQMAALPFSTASTGVEAIEAGESLGTAQKMQVIDTVGNMVGVALPAGVGGTVAKRVASAAGINAAQDTLTRLGISGVAETQEAKDMFAPTTESAALAAVVGAPFAALGPGVKRNPKTTEDKLNALRAQNKLKDPEAAADIPYKKKKDEAKADDETVARLEAALRRRPQQDNSVIMVNQQGQGYRSDPVTELARRTQEQRQAAIERVGQDGDPFNRIRNELAPQEPAKDTVTPVDPMDQITRTLNEQNEQTRYARAQEELEARQRALDEELKRQMTLAQNTAERQRALSRSTGFEEWEAQRLAREKAVRVEQERIQAEIDRMRQEAEAAEKQRIELERRAEAQRQAEEAMAKRQAEIEFQVKRQATLDREAAFRRRTEGAPTGYSEWKAGRDALEAKLEAERQKVQQEVERLRAEKEALDKARADAERARKAQEEAQEAVRKRQEALEQEVKRQATLDFNAAERARREGRSAGKDVPSTEFLTLPEWDKLTSVEERLQRQRDAVRNAEEDAAWRQREAERAAEERLQRQRDEAELQREPGLTDMETRMRQEANKPQGTGQGPKTREAKAAANPGFRLNLGNTRYGRRQGGFIDFGSILDIFKKKRTLELLGKEVTGIPEDPEAASVIALAKTEKGDYAGSRYVGAGATLESMKSGSRAVYEAGKQIVQNWGKRTEAGIRQFVFPFEESIRRLNGTERVELQKLFQEENAAKTRYTPEELAKAGFSDKQIRAYVRMREMFEATLELQNEARKARGEKPISGEEAYVAHSWQGAFGRRIFDASGNTVWVLRGDNKWALDAQAKKLVEKFPELRATDYKRADGRVTPTEFDNLTMSRFSRGADSNDIQSAYSTMIDIMGRDNPLVQEIAKYVEQETMRTAGNTMNQQAHFKEKTGVRGYLGDNPFASAKSNANDFFNAQAEYAKNAIKWAEVQKGMENLKKIMNDPWLLENQPKSVKWLKEYVSRDLGFGENQQIRNLENALGKKTGISPQGVNRAVGGLKYLWVTQKLVLSLGYTAANVFQLGNTLPFLLDLNAKGFGGNPAKSAVSGTVFGTQLATFHYMRGTHMGGIESFMKNIGGLPDYIRGAMEYAENNSVTNRSVYDETGINPNAVGRVVQGSITVPETFVRSIAFMSFVQHLKDSGMFNDKSKWQQAYRMAEDYTNAAMVDARLSERAGIFAKAGLAGNAFNTLQSFTMNFYNQWSYFSRELVRGNPTPFFTAMLVQASLGGVFGIPLVNDLNNMWEAIKNSDLISNKVYNKIKDWDLKMALLESGGAGQALAYGAVSDLTDVGFSSRLQAPFLSDALTMPGSMITDIGKQANSFVKAAIDGDDPVKWTQALLNSSPPGLKELIAQSDPLRRFTESERLPDGTTPTFSRADIADRRNVYGRTDEEKSFARATSLKSQDEVLETDLNRWSIAREDELRDRRSKQINSLYTQIRTGRSEEQIKESAELFFLLGGSVKGLQEGLYSQVEQEFLTNRDRNAMDAKKNIERIKAVKRVEDILTYYQTKQ